MQLPFDVRNQIIQCIGTGFHYKDNVESFFASCGIPKSLAGKHKDCAKFVWTRNLLNELDQLEDGYILQRKILTELCKFRNIPDKDAPNPDAGISALRKLKELAADNKIIIKQQRDEKSQKANTASEKQRIIEERKQQLADLRTIFYSAVASTDRQGAGYALEDILAGC